MVDFSSFKELTRNPPHRALRKSMRRVQMPLKMFKQKQVHWKATGKTSPGERVVVVWGGGMGSRGWALGNNEHTCWRGAWIRLMRTQPGTVVRLCLTTDERRGEGFLHFAEKGLCRPPPQWPLVKAFDGEVRRGQRSRSVLPLPSSSSPSGSKTAPNSTDKPGRSYLYTNPLTIPPWMYACAPLCITPSTTKHSLLPFFPLPSALEPKPRNAASTSK